MCSHRGRWVVIKSYDLWAIYITGLYLLDILIKFIVWKVYKIRCMYQEVRV